MTDESLRINSEPYWDMRFQTDWESLGGREQSRFFAQKAIEHLPQWFLQYMRQQPVLMCDWGCSSGDGTDVLASHLGRKKVCGVDFSHVAIEKAKGYYSDLVFEASDWLTSEKIEEPLYDVVFSSNTLEHFHDPYSTLSSVSQWARHMVVLVLPFQEIARHIEHHFTFLGSNIPLIPTADFVLLHAHAFNTTGHEPAYWDGEQIVLIYARTSWLQTANLSLDQLQISTDVEPSSAMKAAALRLREEEETHIVELRRDFTQAQAALSQLQAVHEQTVMGAGQLQGQVAALTAQVTEMNEHFERQMASTLAHAHEKQTAMEQFIAIHVQSIHERDVRIQVMQEQNAMLSQRMVDAVVLAGAYDRLSQKLAAVQDALTHETALKTRAELNSYALTKSLSWRVTQPLRRMANAIRSLRGILSRKK